MEVRLIEDIGGTMTHHLDWWTSLGASPEHLYLEGEITVAGLSPSLDIELEWEADNRRPLPVYGVEYCRQLHGDAIRKWPWWYRLTKGKQDAWHYKYSRVIEYRPRRSVVSHTFSPIHIPEDSSIRLSFVVGGINPSFHIHDLKVLRWK